MRSLGRVLRRESRGFGLGIDGEGLGRGVVSAGVEIVIVAGFVKEERGE